AFHTENNLFGSGAFVSTFISGDWPLKLEWRSDKARREEIEINEERILKAYTTFRKEFEDYIQNVLKQSGKFGRDLWP
ncbi:MAG: hypothetical protein RMI04_09280, partial [Thermofilaceae archaeon]|nr:hypothetical protein [Thermofilaceae archaeon]